MVSISFDLDVSLPYPPQVKCKICANQCDPKYMERERAFLCCRIAVKSIKIQFQARMYLIDNNMNIFNILKSEMFLQYFLKNLM